MYIYISYHFFQDQHASSSTSTSCCSTTIDPPPALPPASTTTTSSPVLFRCDICGFSFATRRNLVRHMEKHASQKKFKCSVCSKAFHRKDVLRRHERLHGQPNNPPIRRPPVASNAGGNGFFGGRIAPRGRRVRGAGASVPSTRSRRATTAAATTRQRMAITRMSSAFQGACVSWRLEFPEIRNTSGPLETDASHGANVQKLLEDAAGKMQNYILRYQRR